MNPEGATKARFYHELGHNFDYYELGRWASRRFREIIGDDRPWRTKPGEIGLSPHEIFAEAYSVCARRRHIEQPVIQLPPIVIGPAEHDAVCDLIRDAYKLEQPRPGHFEQVTDISSQRREQPPGRTSSFSAPPSPASAKAHVEHLGAGVVAPAAVTDAAAFQRHAAWLEGAQERH